MSEDLQRLKDVMARLRDPDGGCPWDVEQSFATIAPYTIEEAYEVADAIARNDMSELKAELGDLLFQVVFHAQMASEAGAFDFDDVAAGIVEKMVRRHPHVFGTASDRSADEQTSKWEEMKAEERRAKGAQGVLDDVPLNLPALTRSEKLQKRAARVGFDWAAPSDILEKLNEEAQELVDAAERDGPERIAEEFGDLMFVMVNLGRRLGVDAETALRGANEKFTRRFRFIEAALAENGRTPSDATLAELEAYWVAAKAQEKAGACD